ncbi:hypothetical protein [Streptomyces sp. SID12488]|nr:hypothetical protein [Streptomyces sp. SID12488]NEA68789.1 hypothetical protein [Streptomyces sp. SID12488]
MAAGAWRSSHDSAPVGAAAVVALLSAPHMGLSVSLSLAEALHGARAA